MTEKERKDTIGMIANAFENEACDYSWAGVVQQHFLTEHQLPDLPATPPDTFPPESVRRLIYSREELFSLRYRQAASRRLLNHLETLGILIIPKQEGYNFSTEKILGEQASFPHLLSGLGLNLAFSAPVDSSPYSYSENKDSQFSLPGDDFNFPGKDPERKTYANLTEVGPFTDNLAGRKDRPTVFLKSGNESLTENFVYSEESLVKGDILTPSKEVEKNGASATKVTVKEPSAGDKIVKFTESIKTALDQYSDHLLMAQTSSLSSLAGIDKSISQATEEAAWLENMYVGGDVQSTSSDESFESCPDVPCPAGNVDTCSDLISCSGDTAKVDSSESVNIYVESVSREILAEVLDTVKEKIHNDAKQAGIPRNSLHSEKAHFELANMTNFAPAECLAVKHEMPKAQEAVSHLDDEAITSLHNASVYAALHMDMPTNGSLEIKTYDMQNPTASMDYLLSRNLAEIDDKKIHMYVEQRCFEPDDAGTNKSKIDANSMLETEMVPTKTSRKKRIRRSKNKAASVEPDRCDPAIVPYENQSSVSEKSRSSSPMEEKAGSNSSNMVTSESGSLPSELSEAISVVTADDENSEEPVHTREKNFITLEGVEGGMLSGRDFSSMSRAFVDNGNISEQGVCICQLLIQVFHEGCRYHWTGGQGTTRLSFLDHLFVVKDRVYQVQEEFGTPSPFMCPEHGVLPDCVQNSRCELCSYDGSLFVSPSTAESVSSHVAQSESKIWPSFPVPISTSLVDNQNSVAAVYQPRAEELSIEGVSGDSKLSAEDKEKRKVLNKAGRKLLKLKSRIDKELGQWSDQIKEYLTLDTAAENCIDKAKEVLEQQLSLVTMLLQQQHLLMLSKLEAEHKAYIKKLTQIKKKILKYEKSLVKTQTAVQKHMDKIVKDRNTDAADAQEIAKLSTKFYSMLNTKPELEITRLSVNVHMPDVLKDDIESLLGNFDVNFIVPQPSPKLLPASQALDKSPMKLKQIKKQPFTPPLWPGFERKPDGSSAPVKSKSALRSTKEISKSLNNLSIPTSFINNEDKKCRAASVSSKKGGSSTDKSAKEQTMKVPLTQEKLSLATAEKKKKQTTKVEQQMAMDVKENPQQKLSCAKHDKIGAAMVTSSTSKGVSVKHDKINSETVSPAHTALALLLGKDDICTSVSAIGGATYSNMTKFADFSLAGAFSPITTGMLASSVVNSAVTSTSSWVRISPGSLFQAAASNVAFLPETLTGPAKKKKKKSKKKKLAVVEEASSAVASDVAITRLRSVCVTASPKKIEVRGKEATGFAPRLGGEVWLVYGCRDPHIDLINERGELLETTRIGGNAWHAACFNDDHILVSFHSPCHLKLLDVKKLPKETFDLSFAPTGLGVGSTGIVTSSRKALYWISLDGDADKWVVNPETSPLIDVCSCDVVITPVGTEIVCAADKGGHQVVFYEKTDGGTFVAWPSFAGLESEKHKPPPFTPICVSAHTSGLLAILDSGSYDVLMADLTEMHCRVISCIRSKQLCQGVPSIITFALKGSDEDPKLWVASNNGNVYLASLLFSYYDNLV